MKNWKRNAIVATVLVLICAGVYLNWNAAQETAVDIMDTLDAEQVMSQTIIDPLETETTADLNSALEGTFAQIRLSKQESRDNAVNLLQETMAYGEQEDSSSTVTETLDALVNDALAEAQIESLVITKGYSDCVAYIAEDGVTVAVSAGESGLLDSDIALISDIVTTQTGYNLSQLRVVEVK